MQMAVASPQGKSVYLFYSCTYKITSSCCLKVIFLSNSHKDIPQYSPARGKE